jgi:signal transduction histidine kinase
VTLDLDVVAPTVATDAGRLRIALVNMLVNARHAVNGAPGHEPGPNGVEPEVMLRTRANGDRVTIVIADRGAGIEPAHLAHVFDPYFTTKRGGTGLGLAIAKNIVEGLGGTIGIDSAPGEGTEIRINLPYNPA